MASQEGCDTLTWEIRNFSLFLKVKERTSLMSPEWVVQDTERTSVKTLEASYMHGSSAITFFVRGMDDRGIRHEMSFISSCGDVPLKADPNSRTYLHLPSSALFDKNRQSILLNDTFTLCCKTWGKAIKTAECHIATVLHSLKHLWTTEKLASSDFHYTYIEQENFKFWVCLKKNNKGDWMVEGEPDAPDLSVVVCVLSIKDSRGQVLDHYRSHYYGTKCFYIRRTPNITGGLTLQLEFIVALRGGPELPASSQAVRETQLKPNSPTNIARPELSASSGYVGETQLKPNPPTNISRPELPASSRDVRETQLKLNSPTNIAKHKNVSGALGYDLLLLRDVTLNTVGKSFSAHRAVLAARSPVFRAMFEKEETSEGQSGVVDIDDVDSETVDRMLVYLYADSVGDLAIKEASSLYYAADKYKILPLKEKCADSLKACLAADNACDVLVLADKHSDQELMMCVVDFILGNEEVVSSAQWEELEKSNPMICSKITRELFLKKGTKKMRV